MNITNIYQGYLRAKNDGMKKELHGRSHASHGSIFTSFRMISTFILLIATLTVLLAPNGQAQLCNPQFKIENVQIGNFSGAGQRLLNPDFSMAVTVGQSLMDTSARPSSKGMAMGFWGYLLTEPMPPFVTATDGQENDHILVTWDVIKDPIGPQVTGPSIQLYKDGQVLATLPVGQTSYRDYNVQPGRTYLYELVSSNYYGDSRRGSDVGFVLANGTVTGKIETSNQHPVEGVEVKLSPTLGTSLSFNGSGWVTLNDSAYDKLTAGTIEMWVNLTDSSSGIMLSKQHRGGAASGVFSIGKYADAAGALQTGAPGKLYFHGHNGVVAASSFGTVGTNTWHHIAVAFSSSKVSFYIDGQLDNTITGDYSIPHDTDPLNPSTVRSYIGSWEGSGTYFKGLMDDFRIWHGARTRTDIVANMNRTISGAEDSIIAYWKFDEGTGQYVFDLSSHKQVGALCGPSFSTLKAPIYISALTQTDGSYIIGGVNYGSGQTFTVTPTKKTILGRAIEFDGVNDYGNTRAVAPGNLTKGTVETWIYLNKTTNNTLLTLRDNGSAGTSFGVLSIISSHLQFKSRSGVTANDGTTFAVGHWYHVAVSFDSASIKFYVNGDLSSTFNGDYRISGTTDVNTLTSIATLAQSNFMGGRLDDIRIWNVVRTNQEIQAVKDRTLAGTESGLAAYWRLDEGQGTIFADDAPGVYNGTLYNVNISPDSTVWTDQIALNELFEHVFYPESRNVTLNFNSPSVDRLDYQDISQIAVSGYVRFSGTSCFEDSVEVYVDGSRTVPPTYSDRTGKFIAEFEPGTSHRMSFVKEGHGFSPAFWDIHNISEPLVLPVEIQDFTTRTLKVVVAGGTCQYSLGKAQLLVTSASGCFSLTTYTDSSTGVATISNLPPLNFIVEVTGLNNTPIDPFPDALQAALKFNDDSIQFNYRAPIQVEVVGMKTDTTCGVANAPIIFNQGKTYPVRINIFEDYNGRRCLIDTGVVTINDYISLSLGKQIPFKNGLARDTLLAQGPNIIPPFTLVYECVAKDTLGSGRTAVTSKNVIVLGHRPRAAQFVTVNPMHPIMILRDPPGDASNSYFQQDSSYSVTENSSTTDAHGFGVQANILFGVRASTFVGIGVGVNVETEVQNSVILGVKANWTFANANQKITSYSFSNAYATSTSDQFVGAGGDVYVGYAANFSYGVTDILSYDSTLCQFVLTKGLQMNKDSILTMYTYSESHLKNNVLPHLDTLSAIAATDSAKEFYSHQARLWRQWIHLNDSMKQSAVFKQNISWDAGAVIDNSATVTSDTSWTWQDGYTVDESVALELGFQFNRFGVQTHFEQTNQQAGSWGGGGEITSAKTFGYHLEDDDAGDVHSVSILTAADGSPVYKLYGGETSCPWEPGTAPREGVQIAIVPTTAINVSPAEPAVFTLNLANTSQTDEDGTYQVTVVQASNPNGAVIKINGVAVENALLIDIPHGQQVPVTLTVERGPIAYDYNNLQVMLSSTCDGQIAATANFSVHFEVPCSGVSMVTPTNHWLVTSSDPDSVYITLNNYDRLNPDFNEVRFQYRVVATNMVQEGSLKGLSKLVINPSLYQPIGNDLLIKKNTLNNIVGSSDVVDYHTNKPKYDEELSAPWITAKVISKADLPANQNFVIFPWNVSPDVVIDGNYEIRAITTCFAQTINGSSQILAGRIDRTPPQLLGSTEPVDGVLGQNDQIVAHFNEQIDCQALHPSLNVHLVNTRTGLEIDKTISCNGTTVVVTPNIQNRFIENQVLRLSFTDDGSAPAYGVRDVYGNRITHSLDYEFYVDRNSMRWNDPTFQTITNQGQTISFTRRIFNTGTFAQSFTLQGLPTWLSASPVNAVIPAGFSQDVNFTISPQLSGGIYKDTIYASTLNGEEDIQLDVRLLCPTPPWSVDASQFEYTMSIDGVLSVDGQRSNDPYDMVAAFVGDEVRGIGSVAYVASATDTNKYQVFLTVHSSVPRGEQLTFKVWDASSCRQLGMIQETYAFVADTVYGRPDRPEKFTASSQVVQQIPLSTGWTWFSMNLQSDDMSVNSLMNRVNPQSNDIIKGQAAFSQYASGLGWVGTLASLNTKSMYQMRLGSRDTIETTGYPVNLSTNIIPVVRGWNWISYQPQSGYEINYALSNLHPLNGDLIKNQTSYAIFVANYGWVGSLTFLSPKVGYLLKATAADTLIYPPAPPVALAKPASQRVKEEMSNQPIAMNGWSVDPAQYQFSMAITGTVHNDKAAISDTLDVVAAMVNNECRGIAQAIQVKGLNEYRFFMLVYSNVQEGEQVEFKFMDASTVTKYMLANHITFQQDGIVGDVMSPYVWKESFALDANGEPILPKQFSLSQNYPNPFNPSTTISYAVPVSGEVEIAIYDVLGQRVKTLVHEHHEAGYFSLVWNGTSDQGHQVTSGIYFYKMTSGSFSATHKLMLLK